MHARIPALNTFTTLPEDLDTARGGHAARRCDAARSRRAPATATLPAVSTLPATATACYVSALSTVVVDLDRASPLREVMPLRRSLDGRKDTMRARGDGFTCT